MASSLASLLMGGTAAARNIPAARLPPQGLDPAMQPTAIGGYRTVSGLPDNSRASRMVGSTEAGAYIPPPGGMPKLGDAPVASGMIQFPSMGPSAIQSEGAASSSGGALTGMMAPAKAKGPKFFDRGGLGERIVTTLSDLALYGPGIGLAQRARREHEQQFAQQQQSALLDYEMKQQQLEQARNPRPEFRNVGNELVRFNPATGEASAVYQGKNPAQEYADSLGLVAGTPQHNTAMQDYVLRANGPTAFGFDSDLEDARQQNRVSLEGVRQNNRVSLRGTPTYAASHPRAPASPTGKAPTPTTVMGGIISRYAAGKPINERETAMLNNYNNRSSGRRAAVPGGVLSLPSPASSGGVRKVSSPQEAMRLPPGTRFQTPDGTIKVRP